MLYIGNFAQRCSFIGDAVGGIADAPVGNHNAGITAEHGLHSLFTGAHGLFQVGGGLQMGSGPLHHAQLQRAHLAADPVCGEPLQIFAYTSQILVAKGIYLAALHALGNIAAICQAHTLRYGNHDGVAKFQLPTDIGDKLLRIKGGFGQVDELRGIAAAQFPGSVRRPAVSQPAFRPMISAITTDFMG